MLAYRIQSKVVQGCIGRRHEVTNWYRRMKYCGERNRFPITVNGRLKGNLASIAIVTDTSLKMVPTGRDITCYQDNTTVM